VNTLRPSARIAAHPVVPRYRHRRPRA
jgi:hypothetical protein